MKADYIHRRELEHLLSALMPCNRLALEISLHTGLRISDVLNLRTAALKPRMTVRELKTGKTRRISLSVELLERCHSISGKVYVFEGRNDPLKHRTRQAVYKDLKRVADIYRIKGTVSPHTARKVYAVDEYHKTRSLKRVKDLLNHDNEGVTIIYAMADELTGRLSRGSRRGLQG